MPRGRWSQFMAGRRGVFSKDCGIQGLFLFCSQSSTEQAALPHIPAMSVTKDP